MTGVWAGRGYQTRDMKRLSLIVASLGLLLGACERHSWNDVDANKDGEIGPNEKGTKRLYEDDHGKGGDKKGH